MNSSQFFLPSEAILEYQALYRTEYGKEIPYEEAQRQAVKLITLFDAVYKPIKKEWISEVQEQLNTTFNKKVKKGKYL